MSVNRNSLESVVAPIVSFRDQGCCAYCLSQRPSGWNCSKTDVKGLIVSVAILCFIRNKAYLEAFDFNKVVVSFCSSGC